MLTLFLVRWIFNPDDRGDTLLRNVGSYKSTRRHIPEDDIVHSENLKPHTVRTCVRDVVLSNFKESHAFSMCYIIGFVVAFEIQILRVEFNINFFQWQSGKLS
jgi:hypothetical protein